MRLRAIPVLVVTLLPAVVWSSCTVQPEPAPPPLLVDACGVEPACVVDFGDVPRSHRARRVLRVINPTESGTEIDATLASAIDGFRVDRVPTPLGAGLSGDLVISVRSDEIGDVSDTLTITRRDDDSTVRVIVRARIVAADDDDALVVQPTACDFGDVAVGTSSLCVVRLSANGAGPLFIDSVTVSGAVELTRVGPAPPDDEPIDGEATILVQFAPTATAGFDGLLEIVNSGATPHIVIPLGGIGVSAPTCVMSVVAVNGTSDTSRIRPGDDVVLGTGGSQASVATGSISAWQWHMVERPNGSTVDVAAPASNATGFVNVEGAVGVDRAGRYCVAATVSDDLGRTSTNECMRCFSVAYEEGLVVELQWARSNDLDLHVTKRDELGDFCFSNTSGDPVSGLVAENCANGGDCNFSTCQGGSGPDWDLDGTPSNGDPQLSADSIGSGAEVVTVVAPVAGAYAIAVNEYAGTSETEDTAALRIFADGLLVGAFSRELVVGQFWEVAVVDIAGDGAVCVEDLSDADPDDECP